MKQSLRKLNGPCLVLPNDYIYICFISNNKFNTNEKLSCLELIPAYFVKLTLIAQIASKVPLLGCLLIGFGGECAPKKWPRYSVSRLFLFREYAF